MGFSSTAPTGTLPHAHSNATGDGGELNENTLLNVSGRLYRLFKWIVSS